jgi:SAM-dependent methyltransferase
VEPDQAAAWSRVAKDYEREFVNPYHPEAVNPLMDFLAQLPTVSDKTAADLGCGTGPLLPSLAQKFRTVFAVDFAEGMLQRARARCQGLAQVHFLSASLTDLSELRGQVDMAFAVNSLIQPDVRELDTALAQVRNCLRPGGEFLGIVPALDGVQYWTMLVLDRYLQRKLPVEEAERTAARLADHSYFDFAFGRFSYRGIVQHFWQPFEIPWRLRRAGFSVVQVEKVLLPWEHFPNWQEYASEQPPWDWFFRCRVP